MMTKEQERAELAKIRRIVERCGGDSYIAMTMDGVLELAEENISNDFGDSWMWRANRATQRANELADELAKTQTQLAQTQSKLDSARAALDAATRAADELKTETISRNERLYHLTQWATETASQSTEIIADRLAALAAILADAADRMADLAETPDDLAYQDALRTYRRARAERDQLQQLKAQLAALDRLTA